MGEQSDADCLCSTLNKECAQLMKSTKDTEPKHIDEGIMKHYNYILPLVKEVHLMELKVKEKQEELDRRKIDKEIALQQKHLLADSISNDDSVLKMWSQSLLDGADLVKGST